MFPHAIPTEAIMRIEVQSAAQRTKILNETQKALVFHLGDKILWDVVVVHNLEEVRAWDAVNFVMMSNDLYQEAYQKLIAGTDFVARPATAVEAITLFRDKKLATAKEINQMLADLVPSMTRHGLSPADYGLIDTVKVGK